MKFARRFLYKAEDGEPSIIITGPDLMDILTHITYLIHQLYCKFQGSDPAIGKAFREMLTQIIADPTSPAWQEDADPKPTGAFEIFFALEKEDAE